MKTKEKSISRMLAQALRTRGTRWWPVAQNIARLYMANILHHHDPRFIERWPIYAYRNPKPFKRYTSGDNVNTVLRHLCGGGYRSDKELMRMCCKPFAKDVYAAPITKERITNP